MELGASSFPRRKTRQIMVGSVPVGGDAPISVQSMTTTKTADINATLQQIASLVATGVDISVEEVANRAYHEWGIGRKGSSNGVLFLVFVDDRKMRFEVGRDAPDACFRPCLHRGPYAAAMTIAPANVRTADP